MFAVLNSMRQVGGALGIAILSTVAVSHADNVPSGAGREADLSAITEGFQTAFAVAVALAALGALLAALLFRARGLVEPTVGAESRIESIGFERARDSATGKDPMETVQPHKEDGGI